MEPAHQYRAEGDPALLAKLPPVPRQTSAMDGYDWMDEAAERGWVAVPQWGEVNRDLGKWPLVIVAVCVRPGAYGVVEFVEGDRTVWAVGTHEERLDVLDALAHAHWRLADVLPPTGPYPREFYGIPEWMTQGDEEG